MVETWKNNRVVLHVLLNYTWQVPKHGAGSMDDVDCNKGDDVWEGWDQVNDQLLALNSLEAVCYIAFGFWIVT